jgi:hypothetical protein
MTLHKIIHDTILHYRRLYNTTQRYATLYDTILHNVNYTRLYDIIQDYTTLYDTIQ